MKLLGITLLALVLAVPALAATTKGETLRATVCVRQTLWTKPVPANATVYPKVYVGAHELEATPINDQFVWWAGRGTLVTLRARRYRAPMRLRIVNANDSCVRVRFLYRLQG